MEASEIVHPINYVARRTGLTPNLIRAWERRYGAVEPRRSATNRRGYTEADVARLRMLKALCDAGHSIGNIAKLGDDELRGILAKSRLSIVELPRTRAGATMGRIDDDPEFHLDRCRAAVARLDGEGLGQALSDAALGLGQMRFLTGLVSPLMEWIGLEWHDGNLRVAQEHLASAVVRSHLYRMIDESRTEGERSAIVVSTPQGQRHEIGAQMAALVASMDGWSAVYLGANTPADELAAAARTVGAKAIALSIVHVPDAGSLVSFVKRLRETVPTEVRIFIGGAGAALIADHVSRLGILHAPSLDAFRDSLREFQARSIV